MEIKISDQAKTIIKQLKYFDKDDFLKWYLKNLSVGGKDITAYLLDKERESNGIQ